MRDVEMKDSSVQPSGLGGGDTGSIGDMNECGNEGDEEIGQQEEVVVQENEPTIITQDSRDLLPTVSSSSSLTSASELSSSSDVCESRSSSSLSRGINLIVAFGKYSLSISWHQTTPYKLCAALQALVMLFTYNFSFPHSSTAPNTLRSLISVIASLIPNTK